MRKLHFVILMASLALNACLPAFLQPAGTPTPDIDFQATIAAGLTSTSQALGPEATPTLVPTATRTASATASVTNTVVSSTPSTQSETPFATFTTGTASTPTNVTGTPGTLVPAASSSPTVTLFPRFYGTQPPAIPFGRLKLINKSKAEAYISIQCVTADGQVSIIEYPVPRRLEVRAPAGKCTYVAWVGGRKMSGSFSLGKSSEKTITLYKDRITIK